ncbi:hypothetical protein CEXT_189871 [Caerostris extrusa]|uniref:Uncharacterized protein n=1 Tax=Caerostris extrusa TaxID=172846 RepID=A0AAV4QS74_CAEEX|nr:hypothetical protein CEXT_189871 [Caerostris extrusa]
MLNISTSFLLPIVGNGKKERNKPLFEENGATAILPKPKRSLLSSCLFAPEVYGVVSRLGSIQAIYFLFYCCVRLLCNRRQLVHCAEDSRKTVDLQTPGTLYYLESWK